MVLPIVAYGDPVLKKRAAAIQRDYPGLDELIANMIDTMHHSKGVGLAAPQVGHSIRLFVADGTPFEEEEEGLKDFRQVFINPVVTSEAGDAWKFNEGCLSIPGIREDVLRRDTVHIEYVDAAWKSHKETYGGIAARIIQHEYDHLEGVLFVDRISPMRRRLLRNRLLDISRGIVDAEYAMRFPVIK